MTALVNFYQTMSLGKVQAAYTIANSARPAPLEASFLMGFVSGNSDYLFV